jgi:hypothetical protein
LVTECTAPALLAAKTATTVSTVSAKMSASDSSYNGVRGERAGVPVLSAHAGT